VRVVPRPEPAVAPAEEQRFRETVQAIFGMRRKQLQRVIRSLWALEPTRAEEMLTDAGIDPSARPETLAPADFARLVRLLPVRQREG
jgi:16S rRNA (adenine1518-N6/adenine1519-N6)-dimethyltransferase